MKQLLNTCLIISSIIIFQCSNEIPTAGDPIDLDLGKISLRVDKANAPEEVVLVEAKLSRAGYDSLFGSLDLLSSTSADITFEDVAAGEWHLKVDAKDSSGLILYTGETDVNILAGVLTQVNLTLVPTGFGTGSIYIYVTWGNTNSLWVDYENNPILISENNYWDFLGVWQPKILYEDGTYKMWYAGLANSSVSNVGYAISSDGINWTRPYSQPVLSRGGPGSWDETAVVAGAVIKENSSYKLYYVGWSNEHGQWHIGLATSSDGINWQKHPNPVLYGTTGWEAKIVPSSVLKINGTFYMYYYGAIVSNNKIGLATSSDGINWTKYSGNPILESTQSWEGTGIYHPAVVEDNGMYRMVYMNHSNNGFGMANSMDGINWSKDLNNPFFTKEDTYNNWSDQNIGYPFLMKKENEYWIYYSGIGGNSSIVRIGLLRKIGNNF